LLIVFFFFLVYECLVHAVSDVYLDVFFERLDEGVLYLLSLPNVLWQAASLCVVCSPDFSQIVNLLSQILGHRLVVNLAEERA
jgi:hypothetical protein